MPRDDTGWTDPRRRLFLGAGAGLAGVGAVVAHYADFAQLSDLFIADNKIWLNSHGLIILAGSMIVDVVYLSLSSAVVRGSLLHPDVIRATALECRERDRMLLQLLERDLPRDFAVIRLRTWRPQFERSPAYDRAFELRPFPELDTVQERLQRWCHDPGREFHKDELQRALEALLLAVDDLASARHQYLTVVDYRADAIRRIRPGRPTRRAENRLHAAGRAVCRAHAYLCKIALFYGILTTG